MTMPDPVPEPAAESTDGLDRGATFDVDAALAIAERDGMVRFDPDAPGGFRALTGQEHAEFTDAIRSPAQRAEHATRLKSEPDGEAEQRSDPADGPRPVASPNGEHDRRPGQGRDELDHRREQATRPDLNPPTAARGLDDAERDQLLDALGDGAGPVERERRRVATTQARAGELQARAPGTPTPSPTRTSRPSRTPTATGGETCPPASASSATTTNNPRRRRRPATRPRTGGDDRLTVDATRGRVQGDSRPGRLASGREVDEPEPEDEEPEP